jgi:hypothetical protein
LTRQLYNDFESVHKTIGIGCCSIFLSVVLTAALTSKPCAIAYSSEASTLRVTRLHLIEDQCIILALLLASVSVITKPIWEEKSKLFAKDASVNTISLRDSAFNLTKESLLALLLICY